MRKTSWLLLLYGLPASSKSERVNLWRKLRKLGAIQFKSSAYLLPDEPMHRERFAWLAKQVRDAGGDASVAQVGRIDGMSDSDIVALFNEERTRDYEKIVQGLRTLKKTPPNADSSDLERLRRMFQEIKKVDYFACPSVHDADLALARAERRTKRGRASKVSISEYRGHQWLTRPRPEIDRVGSAWLIQKLIDPEADFVFGIREEFPNAVSYDMTDGEFTHQEDDCTFETLLRRFAITDKSLRAIAEMIHDADLEDAKYQRTECVGLDRMFKGYGAMGLKDEEILKRGFEAFDGLYAALR